MIEKAIENFENQIKIYQGIIETQDMSEDLKKDMTKDVQELQLLVDWLKNLKEIWEAGDCNNCKFKGHCDIEPELGQLVRYNCYHYSRKVSENE